jgi:hypothetical protein
MVSASIQPKAETNRGETECLFASFVQGSADVGSPLRVIAQRSRTATVVCWFHRDLLKQKE